MLPATARQIHGLNWNLLFESGSKCLLSAGQGLVKFNTAMFVCAMVCSVVALEADLFHKYPFIYLGTILKQVTKLNEGGG